MLKVAENIATVTGAVTGVVTIVEWVVSGSLSEAFSTVAPYAGGLYVAYSLMFSGLLLVLPQRRLKFAGLWWLLITVSALALAIVTGDIGRFLQVFGWLSIPSILLGLVLVFQFLNRRSQEQYKRCPNCAEMVKKEATVCRFCRHRFTAPPASGLSTGDTATPTGTDGNGS
jgi:hypothetical protein